MNKIKIQIDSQRDVGDDLRQRTLMPLVLTTPISIAVSDLLFACKVFLLFIFVNFCFVSCLGELFTEPLPRNFLATTNVSNSFDSTAVQAGKKEIFAHSIAIFFVRNFSTATWRSRLMR
jgi:hypothetical protein